MLPYLLLLTLPGVLGLQSNSRFLVEKLVNLEGEMIDYCRYVLEKELDLHEGNDVHGYNQITSFLEDSSAVNQWAAADITRISDDVTQIYYLKKRLAEQWVPILDMFKTSEIVPKYEMLTNQLKAFYLTIEVEANVATAINNILTLQERYKLPAEKLILGQYGGETGAPSGMSLSPDDVARIADHDHIYGDHQAALEWVNAGLRMCNDTEAQQWLLKMKGSTLIRLERLEEAEKVFEDLLVTNPGSRAIKSNLEFIHAKNIAQGMEEGHEHPNKTDPHWARVCRGEFKPDLEDSRRCRCYVREFAGWERPLLIEELHHDPRVLAIRGATSRSEVHNVYSEYAQQVTEYLTADESFSSDVKSFMRYRDDTPWVTTLADTLRNISHGNNNVRPRQILPEFVISEDGPGGRDKPEHIQNHMMWTLFHAQPIANNAVFLNDVKSGGGLAFPLLNLRVEPEMGTIIFWQFKTKRGPVHPKLRQWVECPVVRGSQYLLHSVVHHMGLLNHIDI